MGIPAMMTINTGLRDPSSSRKPRKRQSGLSIVELMIAIVLGMLLAAGIMTLFAGTSKSSKVQDGLARLQENGRYAMTRMNEDLRMLSGQFCSNFSGPSRPTSNGPQLASRAPWVYAGTVLLPDAGNAFTYANAAPLDPRMFVQGYECTSGTCAPALPTGSNTIPAVGDEAGKRLKGTDVLTVRYIAGSGWPITSAATTCTTGTEITLSPQTGDDDLTASAHSFDANNLAFVSDCQNPSILPVASIAGNVLKLGTVLGGGGGPSCGAAANRDTRAFNFSKDFATVTYFIKLVADQDPGASGRLIPVLVRRFNGADQELVQGVDRLDFLYGVDDNGGNVRYLTASEISARAMTASCPPPPDGVTQADGCMWRSVSSVEVHALLNTVVDIGTVGEEMAFRYSIDGNDVEVPDTADSPVTDLPFGRMMRREFVSLVSTRNRNP